MASSPSTADTSIVDGGPTTGDRPGSAAAERLSEACTLGWPQLDATGVVRALVTTRHGGVSTGPWSSANLGLHVGDDPAAVATNRQRAAARLGLNLADLVFCRQTHGAAVAVVSADDAGRGTRTEDDALEGIDAVVTTDAGVGLVILVADCVPLVLVDPTARVLGVVHAGWRGTTAGVTQATVDTMVACGASPSQMLAAFGPSIHPDEYQVGEEVAQALRQLLGDEAQSPTGSPILRADTPDPDGTPRWRCDLAGANATALIRAGLLPEHLHHTGRHSGDGDFFSDRLARPCGRFAVMARLLPVPGGPALT